MLNIFYGCNKLQSVNIPQAVTSIGKGAFSGCVSLYSINIPHSVTIIEESTFWNCRALSSIVIPENVKTIGAYAFKGCSNLNSITIPDGIISVGNDAFYGTSWLSNQPTGVVYVGKVAYKYAGTMPSGTNLSLKEGTLEISSAAFSGCSGLESISIPEGVTTIGASAFTNCTSLRAITIPKSLTSMPGNSVFYGCSSLKDVTILCPNVGYTWFREVDAIENVHFGDEVKTIGQAAFYKCNGLTSITIPQNVESIGNEAFSMCSSLASVTIVNSQSSIAYNAFYGTPWIDNQPDGLIYIGQVAYRYKGEMPEGTSIVIKDGTVEIADNAFYFCSNLISVSIPGSIRKIGANVFAYCENLKSVELSEGINTIGNSMFSGCINLTSIDIPTSVKEIGNSAFLGCSSLTSIIIPETVSSLGTSAFSQSGLVSVTIPKSISNISSSAFSRCKSLTSVNISDGIKSIGASAFEECSSLASVVIPESVSSLGESVFLNSGLVSIYIPNSISEISTSAFRGCKNLSMATIADGVKGIGSSAFSGCSNLSSINIPKSVETIGSLSFNGCTSLTSVTIPRSVKTIGGAAFADCSINSVTVKAVEPITIPSTVFSYYSNSMYYSYANMVTLHVPEGCKAAYEAADVWNTFKEIVELPSEYGIKGSDLEILRGRKVVLPIELTNEDEVKLCQFDLRLPDGVTAATKTNGKLDATLTERAESHSVSSQQLSNGDYRFVVSSMDNDSFTGNSGTLMEITLDVSATIEAGEYTVKLLNAELSVADGNDLMVVKPADTESKLIVKAYTPGDVNNDGSVSVTDVGCAINYILEQVPSVFIFDAADMNGDENVSVTDVGMIINLILNEGISSSRGMAEEKVNNDYHFSPCLSLQPTAKGYDLQLENKDAFIGFQFDVELSNGTTINGVQLKGTADNDHLLTYRRLDNGKWRVVCYSPTNSTFAADDSALLTISTTGNITVSDIRLTTAGLDELRLADLVSMPTGIANVEQDMKMAVQGKTLCINSDCDTTLRLLTIGGSVCRILHVHRGQNSFDGLRAGIYMIDNKKIIIR